MAFVVGEALVYEKTSSGVSVTDEQNREVGDEASNLNLLSCGGREIHSGEIMRNIHCATLGENFHS